MPVADMAECVDAAVAAALPARVGAAYSIGNATCRTPAAYLEVLPARAWLAPMALKPGSLVSSLRCAAAQRLGDALLEGWRGNEANSFGNVGFFCVAELVHVMWLGRHLLSSVADAFCAS